MTQYLLSVYLVEGEPQPSEEQIAQAYKDVDVLNEELKAAGVWVFAGGLHPPATATVVRVKDGDVLTTDGPFAETKEQLGGFYLLEAPDLDFVLDLFGGVWEATHGTVEVRPVIPDPGQHAGAPPAAATA